MFFDGDNSSGVSGDLESATTIASFMEGHWGMGSTISSHASNKRNEVGAPGAGKGKDDNGKEIRIALADRIEIFEGKPQRIHSFVANGAVWVFTMLLHAFTQAALQLRLIPVHQFRDVGRRRWRRFAAVSGVANRMAMKIGCAK